MSGLLRAGLLRAGLLAAAFGAGLTAVGGGVGAVAAGESAVVAQVREGTVPLDASPEALDAVARSLVSRSPTPRAASRPRPSSSVLSA